MMDWTVFTTALLSAQTPVLPEPALMRSYLHLSWALMLAGAGLWLGRRWPHPGRLMLPLVLLAWTLLPGPVSPAFWLGLAFQAPSLMTTVICLVWMGAKLKPGAACQLDQEQMRALYLAGWGGIVLGWLLLLDTFAVLPVALYAAGFSPAAVGGAAVAASLPWVMFGAQHPARVVSMLLGAVVLLYVLLRLPSGNLWDALLDPWLWLALQLIWLVRGVRRFSAARRGPQATRA